MRPGVDIGVDAQRHRRDPSEARRALRQKLQFGFRLDVEAEDAGVEREVHFPGCLADTGEQDLVRRETRGNRPAHLAFRHHVGAGTELRQKLQHRLVGIRLQRVANQAVHAGKSPGEDLVVPRQRRRRIAIEGRANDRRDVRNGDILGVHHAIAVVEMVHGLYEG